MPVQFACEHCGKTLRVRDELAGKRVKCPKCQGVVRVPAPETAQTWYLQTEDGETYGPVERGELDRWSQEGRITADCQVLREGTDQWQWATDLYPELGPEAASGAPPEQTPQMPLKLETPQVAEASKPSKPIPDPAFSPPEKSSRTVTPAPNPAPASPVKSPGGSGSFDFAPREPSATPATESGPFDFAPSESASTAVGGSLDFAGSGGGARSRTASKKKGSRTGKGKSAINTAPGEGTPKSKVVALLLAFFLGTLGIHRFYLGYTTVGVLMLVTFGGCGIWALVDFILIAIGKVDRDAQGRPLS